LTVLILQQKKTYFWAKELHGETEYIELFKGRIIERYSCLRFKKCLLVVLFLSSRALSDGLEVGRLAEMLVLGEEVVEHHHHHQEVFRLAEMLVLGEEIVEHPQRGLQVQVDNVFGSGLRLGKSTIHHQLKSETHVCHFFIERLRG